MQQKGRLYLTPDLEDEAQSINPNWGDYAITIGQDYVFPSWSASPGYYPINGSYSGRVVIDDEGTPKTLTYAKIVDYYKPTSDHPWTAPVTDLNTLLSGGNGELLCGVNPPSTMLEERTDAALQIPGHDPEGTIYNPFFIGKKDEDTWWVLSIRTWIEEATGRGNASVSLFQYYEERVEGERVGWKYSIADYVSEALPFTTQYPNPTNGAVAQTQVETPGSTTFGFIKLAQGTLNGIRGRFIILNVDSSGSAATYSDSFSRNASALFISESFFASALQETGDYGEDAEDNVNHGGGGFVVNYDQIPQNQVGGRNIGSEDIYGANNSYSGFVKIAPETFRKLIAWINSYTAAYVNQSESNTNGLSNPISGFFEEVGSVFSATQQEKDSVETTNFIKQTMLDSILSAQIVPDIVTGAASNIDSLGGIQLPSSSFGCYQIGSAPIPKTLIATITRSEMSFLSSEPYGKIILHLPFVGEVCMDPSIVFNGNQASGTIYAKYYVDLYSGTVQCEIRPNDQYTYCVKQGSCSINFPYVGTGRNGGEGYKAMSAAMSGIASAAGQVFSGNNISAPSLLNAISTSQNLLSATAQGTVSTPLVDKSSIGSSAYLSPRQAYWVYVYKKPSLSPTAIQNYLGIRTNKAGTIGSFTGFCKFANVNLSACTAPQAVKEQILQRLASGVKI